MLILSVSYYSSVRKNTFTACNNGGSTSEKIIS